MDQVTATARRARATSVPRVRVLALVPAQAPAPELACWQALVWQQAPGW
jgi:hypothetical protein